MQTLSARQENSISATMEEKHDDGGDNVQTLIKEVTRINVLNF